MATLSPTTKSLTPGPISTTTLRQKTPVGERDNFLYGYKHTELDRPSLCLTVALKAKYAGLPC